MKKDTSTPVLMAAMNESYSGHYAIIRQNLEKPALGLSVFRRP